MIIKEAIRRLRREIDPSRHCAMVLWLSEDVEAVAENRKIKLSAEQINNILDDIDRHQDSTIGITWDTIDAYLDDYIK